MKEAGQKEIGKVEPAIKRRTRKGGIKMVDLDLSNVPIASVMDGDKICQIIIEKFTLKPFCEMCNSFDCIHVKYAMSFKQVRKNFIESVKRICHNCGHYNDTDANYCVHCGIKLAKSGDDKQ